VRRAVLNTYIDLLGQADVLHAIRESPGGHVAFLGAGISKEASVPLASEICDDIKEKLLLGRAVKDADNWASEELCWNDPRRRYTACLDAYGPAELRVRYFRGMLKDIRPAFAHHAIALLMSNGVLFETALTTNFDKLLEKAFIEQGRRECQAIRAEKEAEYWGQETDKCYVFKLHGDYDTHNILNTRSETRSIPSFFEEHVLSFLRARGLFVLGLAANEESILDFVKKLVLSTDPRVLSGGVRWGVFVGPRRPEGLEIDKELQHLQAAIENGAVSRRLLELLGDTNDKFRDRRPCSFFPVWGSGNLLLELIGTAKNFAGSYGARLWLDHSMRLHAIFRAQKLNHDVIETHIKKLQDAQRKLGLQPETPDQPVREAFRAISSDGRTQVRVSYGDITSTAMMADPEFGTMRRAVISPEDTTISAGGGVALRLLTKAGPQFLLNELSKLGPIDQGTCAVSSAGNLPVHYILHAAPLRICPDGFYDISSKLIEGAVQASLSCAEALGVGAIWIPLLGAGVGTVPPHESLKAILCAVAKSSTALRCRCLGIVIFQESILRKDVVRTTMDAVLGNSFSVTSS
jgi:O-acetyl-ADP-ribose deacetylase (regulator of RNase III)